MSMNKKVKEFKNKYNCNKIIKINNNYKCRNDGLAT